MIKYLGACHSDAIECVIRTWKDEHPALTLLILLPEAESGNIPVIQQCCRQADVPVAGAVFPAIISASEFLTTGLLLIGIPELVSCRLHEKVPANTEQLEDLACRLAATLSGTPQEDPDGTLFLFFDATVPNIGSVLDALYLKLANRVQYVGANAGSESFSPIPCLFDEQRLVQGGMLSLLLRPHKGAILEHGYRPSESEHLATSTEGNRIAQIDFQPAFQVYSELVGRRFGVSITKENFYELAVHFPFGIMRADHEPLVRIPVQLADDGSLICAGEIPRNAILTLMETPAVDSIETVSRLAAGMVEIDAGSDDRDLLLFYCAGRRLHVGAERSGKELVTLQHRFPGGRMAGALSLGEIGSSMIAGYPLLHNAALAIAPFERVGVK